MVIPIIPNIPIPPIFAQFHCESCENYNEHTAQNRNCVTPPVPFTNIKLRNFRAAALWVGGFAAFAAVVIANKGTITFLRYLLLGLPVGAVIALMAVGYSMVYGIIQLINFAHGEVFMFSTFFVLMFVKMPAPFEKGTPVALLIFCGILFFCAAWTLLQGMRRRWLRPIICGVAALGGGWAVGALLPKEGSTHVLPFFAAYALAIILSCCLGVTMDLLAYRPLRNSPRLIPLITAIGISLFLQNYAQITWGPANQYFPAAAVPKLFAPENRVHLFGTREAGNFLDISLLDMAIIILALLLMVLLQLFILKTRTGKSMRACAQDRVTASLMGIEVNKVVALAFALGAGLAAVVAPLYVIRGTPTAPQMGYIVGILAFASAVLGGIGNITGAMLGGLIIGIIYAFVPLFDALDTFEWFKKLEHMHWITRDGYEQFTADFGKPGQYQLGVAYAFMILIIVFKPTGLLGRATAKRA